MCVLSIGCGGESPIRLTFSSNGDVGRFMTVQMSKYRLISSKVAKKVNHMGNRSIWVIVNPLTDTWINLSVEM